MFKNNRVFKLWAYSASHSTLIIRSEKQYADVTYEDIYIPNVTIDVEFYGVTEINLPDIFDGIEILHEKYNTDENNNKLKLYKINDCFYVKSYGCIIGSSDWGADESRIQNFNLKYFEIFKEF